MFCCWGTHAKLGGRQAHLLELLKDRPLYCLRLTSGGFPSHPLYLPGDLEPFRLAVSSTLTARKPPQTNGRPGGMSRTVLTTRS